MPRKASKNARHRITITTSDQVLGALEGLVKTGLYGNTVAEAAERLVCEGLRGDMKRRRQQLIDPKDA